MYLQHEILYSSVYGTGLIKGTSLSSNVYFFVTCLYMGTIVAYEAPYCRIVETRLGSIYQIEETSAQEMRSSQAPAAAVLYLWIMALLNLC